MDKFNLWSCVSFSTCWPRWRKAAPEIRVTLRTGDPEHLTAQVVAGELDAAVIGAVDPRLPAGPAGQRLPATLASSEIAAEPLVIAVPSGHPLAQVAETAVSDLRGEKIVTLTRGTGLRAALDAACAEAGYTPEISVETDDLVVLAELVGRGFGVALLPRSAAAGPWPSLTMIPLRQPAPHRLMTLIWRRDRLSALSRAFLELTGSLVP
ncbi:LysR substrate-binding domain-containing protein [Nonomuraea sp. NPDC050536]|uniref:LysR substrate-binding domain-containing protein n=1 Tax=Nonomuraea sp. NPDC050536 TaxID=3364366 RepID=UPI0037C51B28